MKHKKNFPNGSKPLNTSRGSAESMLCTSILEEKIGRKFNLRSAFFVSTQNRSLSRVHRTARCFPRHLHLISLSYEFWGQFTREQRGSPVPRSVPAHLSRVYLASDETTRSLVAVKQTSSLDTREIDIKIALPVHPSIIPLHGTVKMGESMVQKFPLFWILRFPPFRCCGLNPPFWLTDSCLLCRSSPTPPFMPFYHKTGRSEKHKPSSWRNSWYFLLTRHFSKCSSICIDFFGKMEYVIEISSLVISWSRKSRCASTSSISRYQLNFMILPEGIRSQRQVRCPQQSRAQAHRASNQWALATPVHRNSVLTTKPPLSLSHPGLLVLLCTCPWKYWLETATMTFSWLTSTR